MTNLKITFHTTRDDVFQIKLEATGRFGEPFNVIGEMPTELMFEYTGVGEWEPSACVQAASNALMAEVIRDAEDIYYERS